MGLLDVMNDDGFRMGLGLLAAAGPRADGAGFGQRMAEGIGYADQFKQAQMKDKFMKAQMDNYQSEIDQRKAAIDKQNALMAFTQKVLGGGGLTQPAQQNSDAGGANGFNRNGGDPTPIGGGGIAGASLNDILALHAMGGPDLLKGYQYAKEGIERKAGSYYDNPVTGKREYIADPTKGFTSNDGVVGVSPGFLNSQAQILGGATQAQEAGKAAYDLTQVPQSDGTQRMMPRNQAVQALNGSQSNVQSPAYNGGDRNTANAESIRMMQSEIEKLPQGHPDIPSIQREIQRLQGSGKSPVFGVSQSDADKARAVDTAKADVVRDSTNQADSKKYGQMLAGIDRATTLLKSGPTASGFGELVDKTANFFGKSTQGADTASQLETLSGWLTSNVPRMEGPQSDKDVMNYRVQAGRVGDKSIPVSQRLAAAGEVKSLMEKYASMNGYKSTSGSTGEWGDKSTDKPADKTVSLNDIVVTAKSSGRTTAQVTAALKAKGYTIGGQ